LRRALIDDDTDHLTGLRLENRRRTHECERQASESQSMQRAPVREQNSGSYPRNSGWWWERRNGA
jgi:hypothetical protein